jgi:hypothetical protein
MAESFELRTPILPECIIHVGLFVVHAAYLLLDHQNPFNTEKVDLREWLQWWNKVVGFRSVYRWLLSWWLDHEPPGHETFSSGRLYHESITGHAPQHGSIAFQRMLRTYHMQIVPRNSEVEGDVIDKPVHCPLISEESWIPIVNFSLPGSDASQP